MSRWYRTPVVLNQIFPQVSNLCWRCQKEEGTLLHIFWNCEGVKDFWKMVSEVVEEITEMSLGENPATFLLMDIPISVEKYKTSLVRHLLITAKACIPVLWKSNISPSRPQWFAKITEIQHMENLTMALREQEDTFREIWAPQY